MKQNIHFPFGFVCGIIATGLIVYNIQDKDVLQVGLNPGLSFVTTSHPATSNLQRGDTPVEFSASRQHVSSPCRSTYPLHYNMTAEEEENAAYRFIERTTYKCHKSMRMGNEKDGGWNRCCDPDVELHPPNCLVYSFGIADDWTFDDHMAKEIGCQVFSFDPSIKTKSHQRSQNNTFLLAGLGGRVNSGRKDWDLKTLGEWRKTLKHDKMPLDYLKFDIEGGEWPALEAMFAEGSLQDVRQLALEIHIGTQVSTFHRYFTFLHALENIHGFRKWSSQPNIAGNNPFKTQITGQIKSKCYEMVYVNSRFLTDSKCDE